MTNNGVREVSIEVRSDHICGHFFAMASPCEVLIDSTDQQQAFTVTQAIAAEAWRIETKYSRYRDDNIIHQINHAQGQSVAIDPETQQLLSFANTCFELSDGRFDVTSGVLGQVWQFDGSDNIPSQTMIEACLICSGWQNVLLTDNSVRLLPGYAIDLGGIGKEYAVDRCVQLAREILPSTSVLVNFGGDIAVTRPRQVHPYWQVGIEHPDPARATQMLVTIAQGGLATSGDARRFLLKDGVRYGHVISPQTGYPVIGAPRSVTVAGENCTQAGLLATLAILQGDQAEVFLQEQSVTHWCLW